MCRLSIMLSSALWIIVIVLAAGLVALGNIGYVRARERESKASLGRQALSILIPELERNQAIVNRMNELIPSGEVLPGSFETTAWETVSGSQLVLGLSDSTLPGFLRAYYLMNQANNIHSKIIDLSTGIASALTHARDIRAQHIRSLTVILAELDPLIKALLASQ